MAYYYIIKSLFAVSAKGRKVALTIRLLIGVRTGWHYLSDATCLMRPRLLCFFRRVKYDHNLLHYSPLLKETFVRQSVVDKWFPLIVGKTSMFPA